MREVVTRSRMAIFVMRYLLLPLMILATTHSLYSQTQTYVVNQLDLGGGYEIVGGGTITVEEGQVAGWDFLVSGERVSRFTDGAPDARLFLEGPVLVIVASDITLVFDVNGCVAGTSFS